MNHYVRDARMTQDVDIFSPTPEQTADELARVHHQELGMETRDRAIKRGVGIASVRRHQKDHGILLTCA